MSTEGVQCGATGPKGLQCTRLADHEAHVTYADVDGQLHRIEWYAVNAIGEPVDEGDTSEDD